jgi:type II secretory pathway component PulJ
MMMKPAAIMKIGRAKAASVEAAAAAIRSHSQGTRLLLQLTQFRRKGGFTIAELLVSVFVLVLVIFVATQLMNSATAITRTGHKQIDTDTQARVVFDRMALDFAQMVKRTDVDYYLKQRVYKGHGNGHGCGQGRNGDNTSDQIAFFSHVPAYNPDPSQYSSTKQSPISLVAYRVNESTAGQDADRYGRLERMAKGLLWNGVSNATNQNAIYPIVFQTGQIDASCTGNSCPCQGTTGAWAGSWSAAICNDNNSRDQDYEVIGPGVFRFEYYYLLKNGRVTDWPWDRFDFPNQLTIYNPLQLGLSQVEAIAVSIAVIDPASRALIEAASSNAAYGDILDLAAELPDFKNSCGRGNGQRTLGDLENQWNTILQSIAQTGQTPQGKLIPREAAKGIRVYNRYFDLKIW